MRLGLIDIALHGHAYCSGLSLPLARTDVCVCLFVCLNLRLLFLKPKRAYCLDVSISMHIKK